MPQTTMWSLTNWGIPGSAYQYVYMFDIFFRSDDGRAQLTTVRVVLEAIITIMTSYALTPVLSLAWSVAAHVSAQVCKWPTSSSNWQQDEESNPLQLGFYSSVSFAKGAPLVDTTSGRSRKEIMGRSVHSKRSSFTIGRIVARQSLQKTFTELESKSRRFWCSCGKLAAFI